MITERKTDLDVLKIIAALFVVGVHVSATAMDLVTEYSADWMIALLVYAKRHWNAFSPRMSRFLQQVSACGLGCYLVHAGILEVLHRPFGITALCFPVIIGVPIVTILIFVLSMASTYVMRKIPVLKRFV